MSQSTLLASASGQNGTSAYLQIATSFSDIHKKVTLKQRSAKLKPAKVFLSSSVFLNGLLWRFFDHSTYTSSNFSSTFFFFFLSNPSSALKFVSYTISPRLSCVTYNQVVCRIRVKCFLVLRRHGAYPFLLSSRPGRGPWTLHRHSRWDPAYKGNSSLL